MGLMDKVKNAVSGSGGSGNAEDEWAEEVESNVSENEGEMEPEPEPEMDVEPQVREWDSAYRFAEDYLEMRGFSDMQDFTMKCMAYQIGQSPMYRDKLSNGVNTMNQITSMQQQLQEVRGGNGNDRSLKEQAEELQAANDVINEAEKLSGKEDQMVQEAMSLGQDLVTAIGQNAATRVNSRDVDSNVNSHEGEM